MNNVITDENHRSPEFTDHPQVKGKTVFFLAPLPTLTRLVGFGCGYPLQKQQQQAL